MCVSLTFVRSNIYYTYTVSPSGCAQGQNFSQQAFSLSGQAYLLYHAEVCSRPRLRCVMAGAHLSKEHSRSLI